jgi:hypothetical protein
VQRWRQLPPEAPKYPPYQRHAKRNHGAQEVGPDLAHLPTTHRSPGSTTARSAKRSAGRTCALRNDINKLFRKRIPQQSFLSKEYSSVRSQKYNKKSEKT